MTSLRDAVVAVKRAIDAGQPVPFAAMNAAAATASLSERDDAIAALLDDVARVSPIHAALRAIGSGSIVEAGATASIGADAIVDVLSSVAAIVAPLAQADRALPIDGGAKPASSLSSSDAEAVRAFPLLVVAAMARLARDVELRKRLRAHPIADALRAIDEATGANHAHYVVSVLDMLDDEPLLLLDLTGAQPRAKQLRAFGVRNGFHLMTLLEGRDPRKLVAANQDSVALAYGWFTWGAVEKSGAKFLARHPGNMLWGEMFASELPQFDGVRVAVKAPPILKSRSFSIGFIAPIHDALEEKLVDEKTLSADEARAIAQKMVDALQQR